MLIVIFAFIVGFCFGFVIGAWWKSVPDFDEHDELMM
jgi:hypothetical protein